MHLIKVTMKLLEVVETVFAYTVCDSIRESGCYSIFISPSACVRQSNQVCRYHRQKSIDLDI